MRLGNWLTVEQSLALWRVPDGEKFKGGEYAYSAAGNITVGFTPSS
jgi:hypothetical protein